MNFETLAPLAAARQTVLPLLQQPPLEQHPESVSDQRKQAYQVSKQANQNNNQNSHNNNLNNSKQQNNPLSNSRQTDGSPKVRQQSCLPLATMHWANQVPGIQGGQGPSF